MTEMTDKELMLEALDRRIADHQTQLSQLQARRDALVAAPAAKKSRKAKGKKRGPVWTPERRAEHGALIRQKRAEAKQKAGTEKKTGKAAEAAVPVEKKAPATTTTNTSPAYEQHEQFSGI